MHNEKKRAREKVADTISVEKTSKKRQTMARSAGASNGTDEKVVDVKKGAKKPIFASVGNSKDSRNNNSSSSGGGKNNRKQFVQPIESSVIYLGHIAHGFYEKQMKQFFAQFGEVKQIKLFRSKKTGKSKGYAFVEFETPDVAKLVAEAMHGYFLHERQLVCHVIPPSKFHEGMFMTKKKVNSEASSSTSSKKGARNDGQDKDDVNEDDFVNPEPPQLVRTEKQLRRTKTAQLKKIAALKTKGIDFDIFEAMR